MRWMYSWLVLLGIVFSVKMLSQLTVPGESWFWTTCVILPLTLSFIVNRGRILDALRPPAWPDVLVAAIVALPVVRAGGDSAALVVRVGCAFVTVMYWAKVVRFVLGKKVR